MADTPMTARQALTVRNFYGRDARLPPHFDRLSLSELEALVQAEEKAQAELDRHDEAAPQQAPAVVSDLRASDLRPPKRPTPARLRTYFLRQFERSGSVSDAAARTGVTPRTVQRWRATLPKFAERYSNLLLHRAEVLEELALQRAATVESAPRFYRGKQVATVERHDNSMLMRVLNRFDRARERELASRKVDEEVERRMAPEYEKLNRLERAYEASLERVFAYRVDAEVRKRIAAMSPSMRQQDGSSGGE
jgi:hypothetical protein